jgi:hypothetical protein
VCNSYIFSAERVEKEDAGRVIQDSEEGEMMTSDILIKQIENYQIVSVKENETYPNWWKYVDWNPFNILFYICMLPVFLFKPYNTFIKCGVIIKFKETTSLGNTYLIDSITYQLSEDLDKDAIEINKIIQKFEDSALSSIRYRNHIKELSDTSEKKCCDQYKRVMEKVTKE